MIRFMELSCECDPVNAYFGNLDDQKPHRCPKCKKEMKETALTRVN